MPLRRIRLLRAGLLVAALVAAAGIAAASVPMARQWWKPNESAPKTVEPQPYVIEPTPGQRNSFRLGAGAATALGIQTTAVQAAHHPFLLKLSGSLAIDANHLVRVRSRFAGEILSIGTIDVPPEHPSAAGKESRPIRFGDHVKEGQLLAVLWSKELGEKKSELVDALAQFHVDFENLKQMEKYRSVLPERSLREQESKVALGRNAITRAERTLLVWRLSAPEIEDIKKEAERIIEAKHKGVPVQENDWARVEIRAPFAGTVLEKNCARGDYVDLSAELYKIADLQHLSVWAHAYEEDLPRLQELPREQRRWTITLQNDAKAKPLTGAIATIGDIIDPNQHTALVSGHVENAHGQMRVGQFITATVAAPPPSDEVEIPAGALVEDGATSLVLVQNPSNRREFTLRRVAVARRLSDSICVKRTVTAAEKRMGMQALLPGEQVVTSGVLELAAAWKELQGTLSTASSVALE